MLRPVKAQYLLVQATQGDGKESMFLWQQTGSTTDLKKMPPPVSSTPQPRATLSPPHPPPRPAGDNNLSTHLTSDPTSVPDVPRDIKSVDNVPASATTIVCATVPQSVTTVPIPSEDSLSNSSLHFIPEARPATIPLDADITATQRYNAEVTDTSVPITAEEGGTQQYVIESKPIILPIKSEVVLSTSNSPQQYISETVATTAIEVATEQYYNTEIVATTATEVATAQHYKTEMVATTAIEVASLQHYNIQNGATTATEAATQHYNGENVATGADLSSTQSPSLATLRRFVSSKNTASPLPSLSVEKFLSGLEQRAKLMSLQVDQLRCENLDSVEPEVQQKDMYLGQESGITSTMEGEIQYTTQQHFDSESMFHSQTNSTKPLVDTTFSHSVPSLTSSFSVATSNTPIAPSDASVQAHASPLVQAHIHDCRLTNATALDYNVSLTTAVDQSETTNLSTARIARLDEYVSPAMSSGEPQSDNAILEVLVNSAADNLLTPTLFTSSTDAIVTNPITCIPNTLLVPSNVSCTLPVTITPSSNAFILNNSTISPSHVSSHPIKQHMDTSVNNSFQEQVGNMSDTVHLVPFSLSDTASVVQETLFLAPASITTAVHLTAVDPALGLHDTSCTQTGNHVSDNNMVLSGSGVELSATMDVKDMILQSTTASVGHLSAMYHPREVTQIAMKGMLIDEQLITPETVRLDALVNSALDNHTCTHLEHDSLSSTGVQRYTQATRDEHIDIVASSSCGRRGNIVANMSSVSRLNNVTNISVGNINNEGTDSDKGLSESSQQKMLAQELAQMSENDLLSYINPSCFDAV